MEVSHGTITAHQHISSKSGIEGPTRRPDQQSIEDRRRVCAIPTNTKAREVVATRRITHTQTRRIRVRQPNGSSRQVPIKLTTTVTITKKTR